MIRNTILIPISSIMIATSFILNKLQNYDTKYILFIGISIMAIVILDLFVDIMSSHTSNNR